MIFDLQGEAYDFAFYFYSMKWPILDIRFRALKPITSISKIILAYKTQSKTSPNLIYFQRPILQIMYLMKYYIARTSIHKEEIIKLLSKLIEIFGWFLILKTVINVTHTQCCCHCVIFCLNFFLYLLDWCQYWIIVKKNTFWYTTEKGTRRIVKKGEFSLKNTALDCF